VVVVVRITGYLFPVGKIAKKSVWRECVFINSALKIQCHIVSKYSAILSKIHSYRQCSFRRFCPLG